MGVQLGRVGQEVKTPAGMTISILTFPPPTADLNSKNLSCGCNRTVAASRIKNTNLLLIVSQSESHCPASSCPSPKIARDPVEDADSGHAVCDAASEPTTPLFRRRPQSCDKSNVTSEDTDSKQVTDCSSDAPFLKASHLVWLTLAFVLNIFGVFATAFWKLPFYVAILVKRLGCKKKT